MQIVGLGRSLSVSESLYPKIGFLRPKSSFAFCPPLPFWPASVIGGGRDTLLFDCLEGNSIAVDEVGIELPSIEAAQEEAVRSSAGYVMEQTLGTPRLAIEVRDYDGPSMKV